MDLGLEGKSAIVTGGSEGIGKATAARLAQEGANVLICARRADVLAEAEAEIELEVDDEEGLQEVEVTIEEVHVADEYVVEASPQSIEDADIAASPLSTMVIFSTAVMFPAFKSIAASLLVSAVI